MLMFVLQKKILKRNQVNQYSIIVSIQISTLMFPYNTSFLCFYCTNRNFWVYNPGLFEITEWEPCM